MSENKRKDNVIINNENNKVAQNTLEEYSFGVNATGKLWFITEDFCYLVEDPSVEMDTAIMLPKLTGVKVKIEVE